MRLVEPKKTKARSMQRKRFPDEAGLRRNERALGFPLPRFRALHEKTDLLACGDIAAFRMCALHEAGHAVVALAVGLGRYVESVAVGWDVSDDGMGGIKFRNMPGWLALVAGRGYVAMCLAGGEATRRVNGASIASTFRGTGTARGDLQAARIFVAEAKYGTDEGDDVDWHDVGQEIRRARRDAQNLLDKHWCAVIAVADEIHDRPISGAFVQRVAFKADASLRSAAKEAQRPFPDWD